MALPYKPHSLRYQPVTEHLNEFNVELIPSWDGESFEFRGQLTPGAYAMVVERFGIELAKPCLLLCDLETGALMTEGGRVLKDGRTYSVKTPPKLWDAVTPTFAEMAVEELDHA